MTEWDAKKVRDTFIQFFEAKGHTFVPSSGSVPVRAQSLAPPFPPRFAWSIPLSRPRPRNTRAPPSPRSESPGRL